MLYQIGGSDPFVIDPFGIKSEAGRVLKGDDERQKRLLLLLIVPKKKNSGN